jgi:hypothetical protein
MRDVLWVVVVAVAIVLVLAIVVRAFSGRSRRAKFETRGLPASYYPAYQSRLTELQAMFVTHPREAVAGARQLVDDMMMRMGYPTRLTDRERLTDMATVERRHADRYKAGLNLKQDSTTEEMRRAMQSYIDLAHDLLNRSIPEQARELEGRREIAG